MIRTIASRPFVGALLALSATCALAADPPAPAASAVAPAAADLIAADVPPPAVTLADNPDFGALREAYGRRVDFNQRCENSRPTKAWTAAQQAKNFAEAYDIAEKWLETCPVSETVHMWATASAAGLNDTAKIELHKRWYFGLLRSVLASGDGKTPATAWKTISVAEEYSVLVPMQLKPEKQRLLMNPMVDVITARPVNGGDPVELYFNPEWHFVRLQHSLSAPKS
jgi:hypothetical protein